LRGSCILEESHAMTDDAILQMKQDFIVDASEMIGRFSQCLAGLDSTKPVEPSDLDWLFRRAHSLKGTSAMFGLDRVSKVAEGMENILEAVRSETLMLNAETADLLLEAADEIAVLLRPAHGEEVGVDPEVVTAKIQRFLDSLKTVDSGEGVEEEAGASASELKSTGSNLGHPEKEKSSGTNGTREEVQQARPSRKPNMDSPLTVKVSIGLIDSVMNTISELYSVRVGLLGIAKRLPKNDATRRLRDDLLKLTLELKRRVSDLEECMVGVRLVPVSTLFERYRSEVRRLARVSDKRVRLAFEGEDTQVDRAVLDRLYDPLLHVIRNAIGHGIEAADRRLTKGKAEEGLIILRAAQESNHIRIDIEDDGRGIDIDRIRDIAAKKGMIGLSEESLVMLLFNPGFSTKAGVDSISGRGVGLDAAKTGVEAMRGMISCESKRNRGTTFSIWVPLTLAVSRGILLEEGDLPVSIPLGSVIEVLRLDPVSAKSVRDDGFLRYKNSRAQVTSLSRILGLPKREEGRSVVVVGVGEKRRALLTRKVCGETEIVSRPLPEAVSAPSFISGATELHNGRPALVIQPEELFRELPICERAYSGPQGSELETALRSVERWRSGNLLRFLIFESGDGLFGIPLCLLSEVIAMGEVTLVPVLSRPWLGIFFTRGLCHGLLGLPVGPAIPTEAISSIAIFKFPARCGVGMARALGHFMVPRQNLDVIAEGGVRETLSIFGRFKWRDSIVSAVDVGSVMLRAYGKERRSTETEAVSQGQTEPLMQSSGPVDN
jgi:chemotaxis protein histidine kinase CheA